MIWVSGLFWRLLEAVLGVPVPGSWSYAVSGNDPGGALVVGDTLVSLLPVLVAVLGSWFCGGPGEAQEEEEEIISHNISLNVLTE